MLGDHLVLLTLHRGLQLILSKTTTIGDTKYHNLCNFQDKLICWEGENIVNILQRTVFYLQLLNSQVSPIIQPLTGRGFFLFNFLRASSSFEGWILPRWLRAQVHAQAPLLRVPMQWTFSCIFPRILDLQLLALHSVIGVNEAKTKGHFIHKTESP